MKREVCFLFLIFLLVLGHLLPFGTVHAAWTGTKIYIKPDGSVEPSDAPLVTSDGVIYILTDDIIGSKISIERNNIIIEGNNHIIVGTGDGFGISLWYRVNVMIRNIKIINFAYGIFFHSCSDCTIINNTVLDSENGISLFDSFNNSIINNTVSNNDVGIFLVSSNNNIIFNNTISNNERGIILWSSSNNLIYYNSFISNTHHVSSYDSINFWDNGRSPGGNYWSDYTGRDSNRDGFGDEPYVIDKDNKDNYPFISRFKKSIPAEVSEEPPWLIIIIAIAIVAVLLILLLLILLRRS
ncbi:MAG: NosD domain-containing protein [Thermoproteota archaeon]|nr:right-handed parallel beta-helix repeat-containing protein [Candidatus Brockarchaeota archaeon]